MHTHQIDSFIISENIKLEIVNEANPYFAGEHMSMVIRLRHLGSEEDYKYYKDKIDEFHNELDERFQENSELHNKQNISSYDKPWIMSSLFSTLRGNTSVLTNNGEHRRNKVLSEDEKQYIASITEQIRFHKPITLISGSIQIGSAHV